MPVARATYFWLGALALGVSVMLLVYEKYIGAIIGLAIVAWCAFKYIFYCHDEVTDVFTLKQCRSNYTESQFDVLNMGFKINERIRKKAIRKYGTCETAQEAFEHFHPTEDDDEDQCIAKLSSVRDAVDSLCNQSQNQTDRSTIASSIRQRYAEIVSRECT